MNCVKVLGCFVSLTLSVSSFANTQDRILAIQQTQIKQLVASVNALKNRLACVSQKASSHTALSCRTVVQVGRTATCNADEVVTGGGVINHWGVAMVDSYPSGQSWGTASANWNQNTQTALETKTHAVCCKINSANIDQLCP